MFKNRGLYVEMVPKKHGAEIYEAEAEPVDISKHIEESVKGVVVIMGAFFLFKTLSTVAEELLAPKRR